MLLSSSWRSARLASAAVALPFPLSTFATACSSEAPVESASDEINYRSTSGQEFELSTTVTFAIPEATRALQGAEKESAILAQATSLRNTVTTAISAELDRIWPQDQRLTRAGLVIQFRQASAAFRDLTPVDDGSRYTMVVAGEFSGVKDVERKLPLQTAEGKTFLPVSADLGAGREELQVVFTPVERSLNAYPKYLELFEGGLDIGVHLGGDHHDPPMDIQHARSVYEDLVRSGFASPVATFEDLKIDSGPLTSTIRVKGEEIPVRVRIVHVDMSTPETRDLLIDAYESSMKDADVVIYDGHAGRRLDYSGVVLAYKPARASIAASAFKDIATTDKQQVYLFNGCETYTGYSDKLYENPNRNPENTDVITTANFSAIQRDANQVISFIHSFIDQRSGAWVPRSWDSVLSRMDTVGERSWVHVYGVHGLDDNPKVSPLADLSKVGAECTSDADCGAVDSRCLDVSSTRRVCGAACADTTGCPDGTTCVLPRGRTGVDDQQCAAQ